MLAALAAAERVLSRRAGAGIVLADPEDLGGSDRSVVARARVARNPFSLPRTLVVKHYLADPAPDRPDPFHYEVASCQLFTALPADDRSSPVLIAHDPEARLLVLEDLGPQLDAGRQAVRARRRRRPALPARLGPGAGPDAGGHRRPGGRLRGAAAPAGRAGLARPDGRGGPRRAGRACPACSTPGSACRSAAAAVQQAHETVRLLGGTRYRAFSPSDTCPDNNLVTSRGVRFVDFEWGCFRDIVLDAAYFRVPFPGCEASFALPAGLADGAAGGVARPRSPASGRSSTSPSGCSAGCSTPSCCGCGCAPGGCCRGCRTRDRGPGRPDRAGRRPVAADQHRAGALLAASWATAAADGGRLERRPNSPPRWSRRCAGGSRTRRSGSPVYPALRSLA